MEQVVYWECEKVFEGRNEDLLGLLANLLAVHLSRFFQILNRAGSSSIFGAPAGSSAADAAVDPVAGRYFIGGQEPYLFNGNFRLLDHVDDSGVIVLLNYIPRLWRRWQWKNVRDVVIEGDLAGCFSTEKEPELGFFIVVDGSPVGCDVQVMPMSIKAGI